MPNACQKKMSAITQVTGSTQTYDFIRTQDPKLNSLYSPQRDCGFVQFGFHGFGQIHRNRWPLNKLAELRTALWDSLSLMLFHSSPQNGLELRLLLSFQVFLKRSKQFLGFLPAPQSLLYLNWGGHDVMVKKMHCHDLISGFLC